MSVKRKDYEKKIFCILNSYVSDIDRVDDFDISRCYINYSDREKEKVNRLKFLLTEKSIPNEVFICYGLKSKKDKDKLDIYFIVNEDKELVIDNMSKEETDIIDLFILCKEYIVKFEDNKSKQEIYDNLFTTKKSIQGIHTQKFQIFSNHFQFINWIIIKSYQKKTYILSMHYTCFLKQSIVTFRGIKNT